MGPADDITTVLETVDDPRHGWRLNLLRCGQLPHQLVSRVQQHRHRRQLIRVEVNRIVAQLTEPPGQPGNRPQVPDCKIRAGGMNLRYGHPPSLCLALLISKAKESAARDWRRA